MAQFSIVKKASAVVVVALAAAATVSAQEFGMAPAPSPIAGAAFSVPASGAMIATSLNICFPPKRQANRRHSLCIYAAAAAA
ncbi:hypothetical protein L1987_51000 [Smallanthus sonchifolius]|uniref:Uncharacterized protein n=1 Tax=Smallanthus sonchifolius TaxID=185202 RepID=A0ACB9EPQ2_9ASTR|nr:hypothetical protein L1987_51000 [Smallanthus sonchifolius]